MVKEGNFLLKTKMRMDNSGENNKFKKILEKTDLDIKIEFTPRNVPQFNAAVERSFGTLYGRVRAMLNAGGFFGEKRALNWAECANTATQLDHILAYSRGALAELFTSEMN